jgi:hypothetical protein
MLVGSVSAAEKAKKDPDQPRVIRGEGMCAKCELGKSEKCQAVIQVKAKNKEGEEAVRTIYLAENDVSKEAHKKFFCSGKHPVEAKGTVERDGKGKDAKMTLTATDITEPKHALKEPGAKGKRKKAQS